MLNITRQRGFSLVELMVAIVIVATLLAMAVPSYMMWIQNQQTRVAAESILNGLQLARAEAVRINGRVRFVLCGKPSSSWEVLATSNNPAVPAASLACGAGSDAGVGDIRVQERSGQEGSRNVKVEAEDISVPSLPATTVTFNSFGRIVTPNAVATNPNPIHEIDAINPNGDRPLRINVGNSGSFRMCDPALLVSNDPRGC